MTKNIMKQYIDLTKKQINFYLRLVFDNKFDAKIADAYTQVYINCRYYNFYEEDINNSMRRKILEKLKEEEETLSLDEIEKRDLIEQIRIFFYYILYFDDVVYYKDLMTKIKQIEKLRQKILKKKSKDFVEKLFNKISQLIEEKKAFLDKFNTEDFKLKISNYSGISNVYKVNLQHQITFPMIYSQMAIQKAFCTGVINEDKLLVEYSLLTVVIIKDIIKQNFRKKYIAEFTDTILNKKVKMKSLFNIIDNSAIQEKLNLKIKYEKFLKNKEEIYELMRYGYKIAIVLDDSFEVNYTNFQKLNVFEFIIVSKKLKKYDEIIQNKNLLHNLIEI